MLRLCGWGKIYDYLTTLSILGREDDIKQHKHIFYFYDDTNTVEIVFFVGESSRTGDVRGAYTLG